MMKNSIRALLTAILTSALLISPWNVRAADDPNRAVGPQSDGSIVASNNQTLTPAGTIVDLGSPVRAKAVALNPSRKNTTAAVLLMGAAQPIIVFNTQSGQVLQRFIPTTINGASFTSNKAGSFTGIAYSADGTRLFFSQDDNHVVIAKVNPDTGFVTSSQSVVLPAPPADGRPYFNAKAINPGGIAVSEDGRRAYVVLNAANSLGVIDLTTPSARLVAQLPVGNAPNSIVIRGNRAYVSNEGGRPATQKDFTRLSDGTPIVADRRDAFAITGTVSVVDLAAGKEVATIAVGLHPAGMAIAGSHLYVANSYSDSVSDIDLDTGKVVRTLGIGVPVAGGAFGSGPNAIAVTEAGQAYVTLGQSNAVAVINLMGRDANPVIGYIPTAYFPTSIVYDAARKQLVVADDKGLGAQGSTGSAQGVSSFNTHQDTGVINLIPLPAADQLASYTSQVIANNHWNLTTNIQIGPEFVDRNARPVAVPKHIGEPSLIKHVFLIIKENRTYDQMLGDVPQGNGDPSLAIFASATPNQHAFIQRFPLLDNVYAPSRQSADGHPWIVLSGSFYSNDILSPDWIRSYPGGNSDDALTYTPRGFLWSAAAAKGLSVKMYGEWADDHPKIAKKPDGSDYNWSDFYATAQCKEGLAPASSCIVPDNAVTETSSVPSAAKILDPHFPAFNLTIPDQYRVDYWLPIFNRQLAANQVPNLTILWLPNDHTNGTTKGFPYPINYQADNDLALGRIVEAISHSKVWGQSAIFVEEDDAQNGVDHVDGHRQPVYVISPYATAPQAPNQGKVIHTTYTAENINRTIENILGMQPLTQFDLVASPMFDAFQDASDLAPFSHLPASIPLDQGPGLAGTKTGALGPLQKAWLEASHEVMKDRLTKADAADPNFLNHVTWYSATGWKRPYPGEKKLLMPGPFVKAARNYHDDDDE
ncbi:MAG TPA: bifunctional YncE family protein/alkaline phosphatase family protein [Rhizomicrobium sp.]|nr:bifunctional YncE family protein/alkaline phosphatase family protein [Rhizomicrobium sp.]